MSYTTQLLYGLGADIAQLPVGAVWREDGIYQPGERAIFPHVLPEQPDEAIVVSSTNEADVGTYRRDVESVVTFVQVQVRMRKANDGFDVLAALHDRYDRKAVVLRGPSELVAVTGRMTNSAPLGRDETKRYLFTANFTFTGLRARSL